MTVRLGRRRLGSRVQRSGLPRQGGRPCRSCWMPAGRPRSPATIPGYHAGRPPRNKGRRNTADPPTIEAIVAVMRHAGNGLHGHRLRGLVVVLWRAGLRTHEALLLNEGDLGRRRCSCGAQGRPPRGQTVASPPTPCRRATSRPCCRCSPASRGGLVGHFPGHQPFAVIVAGTDLDSMACRVHSRGTFCGAER